MCIGLVVLPHSATQSLHSRTANALGGCVSACDWVLIANLFMLADLLSTHTTPWPHFIIDVGLVQRGYSIPSPVLLKCCVASVVA